VRLRAVTEARGGSAPHHEDMTSSTPPYKELRRSRSDRMLAGVCGGMARYFNIDPVAARVAFVVVVVMTGGLAAVAYALAAVVMPEEPAPAPVWPGAATEPPVPPAPATPTEPPAPPAPPAG
jgi:phage shock protein PspC (stress-responsive transcriptional regulator)